MPPYGPMRSKRAVSGISDRQKPSPRANNATKRQALRKKIPGVYELNFLRLTLVLLQDKSLNRKLYAQVSTPEIQQKGLGVLPGRGPKHVAIAPFTAINKSSD